ncbi:MAG: hypothetical protein HDS58_02715 [Barnesiella sp.]|nr:hypothetical protein [Barnesiella sp.]
MNIRTIFLFCILCFTLKNLSAQERIILLNEGNWQADNGKITYFVNDAVVSNQWFRDVNKQKLGDTPNDIIQVNDNLIAISVNWSNIIQYISPDGKAVAATEDVPNNRCLTTDGKYVYISSYGHECATVSGMKYFTKGFVAKIDASNFKVVDAVEVGYEPEGIALYNGHLFVANTGGYAFQENHDYETTVTVLDAATLKTVRNIDTGQINLYGKMSQSGKYLCINSPGDYYDVQAATIILDCDAALRGLSDRDCFVKLEYAATYSCTASNGNFYAVGARYSYYSGEYTFNYIAIDPARVMESGGADGISDQMPGTVVNDIKKMTMPYGIYVNPYTGYIYATDAGSFAAAGGLYQWSPEGKLLGSHKVYINPGHFLALPPDGMKFEGVEAVSDDDYTDHSIYNLQGIKVTNPIPGQLYIHNGKKFIHQN